jgi:3-oxoacyl-[acyl-carrier-protein] synthase II
MARRVVITAMGLQSSLGDNSARIMENFRKGKTQFHYSKIDPEVVICPIAEFNLKAHTGPCKNRRYLNRGAAFAVATAMAAVQESGLTRQQLSEAGLFVGTAPNLDLEGELPRDQKDRIEWRRAPALWLLKFIANTPAALISRLTGITGESLSIQTACTAGLTAVGEAYRKIKDGYLELALAGAGDSRLNSGGIMAYKKAQALYSGNDAAHTACRPFDKTRKGFVSGEGSAFFLL